MDGLPDQFLAVNYNKGNFIYSEYPFTVTGKGEAHWEAEDYRTGIGSFKRTGIGAFYFYTAVYQDSPETIDDIICDEPLVERVEFWDYLTTFWNFLKSEDRDMFENFWHGLVTTGNAIIKKSRRFLESLAPENSRICTLDDYYDIQVGPLYSKPLNLDPTIKEPNFTMNPIGIKLIEPEYENGTPVYRDIIELSATEYHKIRNAGLDCYAVIQANDEDIKDKAFRVFNLLSSEEPRDRLAYAEINKELDDSNSENMGRIGITAINNAVDISEYNVEVIDNGASPTAVVFGSDTLTISIRTNSPPLGDSVKEVFGTTPTGTTPWATLTNKSGKDKNELPFFSSIEIDDMPNYIHSETANGRYYPTQGKTWEWFEGYPESNSKIGDPELGEYIESPTKFKYMMVVEGDLSYIKNVSFSMYLTTGLSYDIEKYVTSLPFLQTFITHKTDQGFKPDPELRSDPEFRPDKDYSFRNHILEFNENIFEKSDIKNGDYLYSPKTPIIEHMLFENYGALVNNPDWNNFNYTNTSGKAAINSLLLSLQNSNNRADYERALNVYYGMPVAPEKSKVLGLYESYGYSIINIDNNKITLDLPDGEPLHNFIQPGGRFFIQGKKDKVIKFVESRANGTVELYDASGLKIGDELHINLKNKYKIKKIWKEGDANPSDPAFIDIYTLDGNMSISHLIQVISETSDKEIYPEVIVYDTDKLENNYNGIYHITAANLVDGESSQVVRLSLYKASDLDNPIYNDYIGVTSRDEISSGYLHIPWPTHKFLYLLMNGSEYHKAYLDAPIDTIYDEGDDLDKYQVITRNVSVPNKSMFPDWNEFDNFRRFNGIDFESSTLELTKSIHGSSFGKYFPSRFQVTK